MHMLDPEVVLIIKIKQYELKRKILVKDVLEKWQHLTFSNKWFETQIFVEERDLELVT